MYLDNRLIAMLDVLGFSSRIQDPESLKRTTAQYAGLIAEAKEHMFNPAGMPGSPNSPPSNFEYGQFVFDTSLLAGLAQSISCTKSPMVSPSHRHGRPSVLADSGAQSQRPVDQRAIHRGRHCAPAASHRGQCQGRKHGNSLVLAANRVFLVLIGLRSCWLDALVNVLKSRLMSPYQRFKSR